MRYTYRRATLIWYIRTLYCLVSRYTSGRPSGGHTCTKSTPCYGPDHWTDMRDLFVMHQQNGRQPVQYCQCFVYAAVTTSLGRSLGIPTRPVTNFQSAHDGNRNRASVNHTL